MYTHVESLAWHLALFRSFISLETVLLFPPASSHEKVPSQMLQVSMQVAGEESTKPFPGPKPTIMFCAVR